MRFFYFILTVIFISSCSSKNENTSNNNTEKKDSVVAKELTPEDKALIQSASMFKSLPKTSDNAQNPANSDKILLGKMLYHDTRLSKSNVFSCNSCHNLATYGVDNNPLSIGHGWKTGTRNSPTTLNASLNSAQFWDGRNKDVEEQAKGPILNPVEMGSPDSAFVEERIKSIPAYVDLFKKAFPNENDPLNFNNIANAIGVFERTLLTPARFDDFLNGNGEAISNVEKEGLKKFMSNGCTACHSGEAVGGNNFFKFGLVKGPYWEYTKSTFKDEGKFTVTKQEQDKDVFKSSSLRNIEHTYPYFHDGSIWDLKQAVKIMGVTQMGREISDEDASQIVSFMNTLTGTIPADALILPTLPISSEKTTKPDFK